MGGGGGVREQDMQENSEHMDCQIRHLQCISSSFNFSRGVVRSAPAL